MNTLEDKLEEIRKLAEIEKLPILLYPTQMEMYRTRQLIDAGNIPEDFYMRSWFQLAASVGYVIYILSQKKIDGVLGDESFFLDNGKWYVGNLRVTNNRQESRESSWYHNPHHTGKDIYLLGMFLYRILNDGKFPFMNEESFEGIALGKKDQGKSVPLPELGTDFMKELVCRILNGQITNEPDQIKRWLSDLVGMYQVIVTNRDSTGWMDEKLRSLDDSELIGQKERNEFALQDPQYVFAEIVGISVKGSQEVQTQNETNLAEEKKKVVKKKEQKKREKRKKNNQCDDPYKELNKKTRRKVFGALAVMVVGISVLMVCLPKMNNQKVYSYIRSGSYALALDEMQKEYGSGKNVDKVAAYYIEVCNNKYEYKRVVQAIALLSDSYLEKHREEVDQWVEAIVNADASLEEEMVRILQEKNLLTPEIEQTLN